MSSERQDIVIGDLAMILAAMFLGKAQCTERVREAMSRLRSAAGRALRNLDKSIAEIMIGTGFVERKRWAPATSVPSGPRKSGMNGLDRHKGKKHSPRGS